MIPDSRSDAVDRKSGSSPAATSRFSDMGLALALCSLQSPINIGMVLRIAEAYQFEAAILDSHGVFSDPEKLGTVRDFACGALGRRLPRKLVGCDELQQYRRGRRLIATSIEPGAVLLADFRFEQGDVLALGNEYDGLPPDLTDAADLLLRIPVPAMWLPKEAAQRPIDPTRSIPVARDGEPSLNVAVAAGILCHAAYADWLLR